MRFSKRLAVCILLLVAGMLAQNAPTPAIQYAVSLADSSNHVLHVQMRLPAENDERVFRLPVWNALYQVRDFAQYLESISAKSPQGEPLSLRQFETSAWRISGTQNGAVVSYDIYADNSGPYGAQVNDHHAFLNLAEVLMYEPGEGRRSQVAVQFTGVPEGWSYAAARGALDADNAVRLNADSYDQLVDTPVEFGPFHEIDFQDGPTKYRIAIDADPADYDEALIENSVRRIVRTETEWMEDRPCSTYVFIYHFPHGQGGGGMEHACSTAIDLEAGRLSGGDMSAFDSVTAHEFFHLWNVKRIRPQSLEPADYTKEQYTPALWFSEGVTSTVENITLLRARLITSREYLRRLSSEIDTLQERPAHRTQSAEQSSLDAWFEKYPFYRRPERSISYYNKGEILGVMLDLAVRDATSGAKSLRDVFLWMNENDAKKGKFFADSDGVREAVEAVTGRDFKTFFEQYVAGTAEIPYDQFLNTAGVRLEEKRATVADAGFVASRNFDALPTVLSVRPSGNAQLAGLKVGDMIFAANDKASLSEALANIHPGDTLRLRVRSHGQQREVKFKVESREASHFSIVEMDHPTAAQEKRRAEWLGEAELNETGAAQSGADRK